MKFESFVDSEELTRIKEPMIKPAQPKTKPRKPNPFRRDRPSVSPKPKAELEEVVNKFIDIMDEKGEDIKKYL